METFLVAVVIANVFVFLFVTMLVVTLVLGCSVCTMLIATRQLLRHPPESLAAAAGSRLSVAMWNDIAEILDERR